jgi:hypothetical protein
MRPYLKTKAKRAVGVAKVEECLPNKYETLSSNPSIAKNGIALYLSLVFIS